ncbi:MAG TPA: hypothetical protein VK961_00045 [Chthoniobacter sp.]|nr:hypothetical protein [Chthoniobacter sp.]
MKTAKVQPLNPPATEAELERASLLWTNASDDLVARGYARHLWGCNSTPAKELVVLLLREAAKNPA